MKNWFDAEIQWFKFEEGGRHMPPLKGTRYCPIIKFDNILLENDWSVSFICAEKDEKDRYIVRIRFLSDDSPELYIPNGSSFNLFEGSRKVARGKVVQIR